MFDRFMPLIISIIRFLVLSFVPINGSGGMACLESLLFVEIQLGASGQAVRFPFLLPRCMGGSFEHPKTINPVSIKPDISLFITHLDQVCQELYCSAFPLIFLVSIRAGDGAALLSIFPEMPLGHWLPRARPPGPCRGRRCLHRDWC